MPSPEGNNPFRRFVETAKRVLRRSETPNKPREGVVFPADPANVWFEAAIYDIEDPYETLQYEPGEFEEHQNNSRRGLVRYYRDHFPEATEQEIAWHVANTEMTAKMDRLYKLEEQYGADSSQALQMRQLIDFDLTLLHGDNRLPSTTPLPRPPKL